MDVAARNKYCGYIMFNTPASASSKGPGSRNNDLINYDASSFSNCDSDLYPQTGTTNHSMAAGAAAIEGEQNVKKEDTTFQVYDPSNNNGDDNGKKLPGSSKMQPEKRPPRPPNAFILYRRAKQPGILATHRNLTNAEISRYISTCWRSETDEERLNWERYADQKKLEHMQAYPNYVYKPNKNKGKNEKRRQARKQSAAAAFASQDTTNVTNLSETGPIRSKKNIKGQNRLNNLVGRIEIPMVKQVANMNVINFPMMTPPLSSPNTPTLNNNPNMTYSTMPFAESVLHDMASQNLRMQELYGNDLTNLTFSDLTPGSFHEETVDPSLIFFPPNEEFYPSHIDSNTTDLNQKINCYPEFRDNSQGLTNIFTGLHNFESSFQLYNGQ
jgi:hypothetical protein